MCASAWKPPILMTIITFQDGIFTLLQYICFTCPLAGLDQRSQRSCWISGQPGFTSAFRGPRCRCRPRPPPQLVKGAMETVGSQGSLVSLQLLELLAISPKPPRSACKH